MGRIFNYIFAGRKKTNTEIYKTIDRGRLPVHVAVIMDGNGRWANKRGLPRAAGHREGVERVRTVVRMSSDIGVRYLTLYAFSTENWKRPSQEVSVLMSLLLEFLRKELDELNREKVRILTFGDLSKLPAEVVSEISRAKETTKNNTGLTLNMAVNYGGRQEIVNAVKKAVKENREESLIDEEYVSSMLDTSGQPDPDLLIRTSGEARISNFLLYQTAYAELYFTDTLWPDFDEAEYAKALKSFAERERRFGAV